MKLIITKCNSPRYWYSNCIGMTFHILGNLEHDGELLFRTDGSDSTGYVDADDCELLIKGHRFVLVPKAIESAE